MISDTFKLEIQLESLSVTVVCVMVERALVLDFSLTDRKCSLLLIVSAQEVSNE